MLKIAHHPIYQHPLPEGHRFPMIKYDLLPKQLLYEGSCTATNFYKPTYPDNLTDILATHQPDYVQKLSALLLDRKEVRSIGFPLSQALVDREFIIANGTIQGTQFALDNGIAMNIAGGTHHAFSDRGEAFVCSTIRR